MWISRFLSYFGIDVYCINARIYVLKSQNRILIGLCWVRVSVLNAHIKIRFLSSCQICINSYLRLSIKSFLLLYSPISVLALSSTLDIARKLQVISDLLPYLCYIINYKVLYILVPLLFKCIFLLSGPKLSHFKCLSLIAQMLDKA